MSIYLVRHAAAGSRHAWDGDDFDRPLDGRGHQQAQAIAGMLAGRGLTRLLSSGALRCTQSLGPLAHMTGVEVEIVPWLREGTPGAVSAAATQGLVDEQVVLCSHGDVLPSLVRALSLDGMRIAGVRGCEKGSVWELGVRGGDIVTGTYLGLPPLAAA